MAPIFQLIIKCPDTEPKIDQDVEMTESFPHIPYRSSAKVKSPSQLVLAMLGDDLKIPRNDHTRKADEDLKDIHRFLNEPFTKPEDLNDKQWRRFINKCAEYFIKDGQLWKKNRQGRHKIVIPEERRLKLITQAHDELRHKGIFTVCMRLLD